MTSMNSRALIDTNVLIFSLLPDVPVVDNMSPKAKYSFIQSKNAKDFLANCRNEHIEIFVSSISVSETLEFLPDTESREIFNAMSRLFTLLPFDVNAAFRAARLAYALHGLDVQKQPEKSKIRNDLYILATGLQYNCTDFYTTDKVLIKQASRLSIPMEVHYIGSLE